MLSALALLCVGGTQESVPLHKAFTIQLELATKESRVTKKEGAQVVEDGKLPHLARSSKEIVQVIDLLKPEQQQLLREYDRARRISSRKCSDDNGLPVDGESDEVERTSEVEGSQVLFEWSKDNDEFQALTKTSPLPSATLSGLQIESSMLPALLSGCGDTRKTLEWDVPKEVLCFLVNPCGELFRSAKERVHFEPHSIQLQLAGLQLSITELVRSPKGRLLARRLGTDESGSDAGNGLEEIELVVDILSLIDPSETLQEKTVGKLPAGVSPSYSHTATVSIRGVWRIRILSTHDKVVSFFGQADVEVQESIRIAITREIEQSMEVKAEWRGSFSSSYSSSSD